MATSNLDPKTTEFFYKFQQLIDDMNDEANVYMATAKDDGLSDDISFYDLSDMDYEDYLSYFMPA